MRNYFTFDGNDSRDFGVYISGSGTFSAPARAYSIETIPGRNGALIGNEKRLDNIELVYPAFCMSDVKTNLMNLRNLLLSLTGYKRLIDTYNPDEFRLAVFQGPFEPDMIRDLMAGEFNLSFNCKPQRYLLSGDEVTELTANGSVSNPTLFASQPWMRIYGTGRVYLGAEYVQISTQSPYEYIDIDCEMMDAYSGAVNCNKYVSVSNNDFPTLKPGSTNIVLGTNITKVQIKPRWWRL